MRAKQEKIMKFDVIAILNVIYIEITTSYSYI